MTDTTAPVTVSHNEPHPGALAPTSAPDPETASTEELVAYARAVTSTAAVREDAFHGEPVRRSPIVDPLALPFASGVADIPSLVGEGLVPDDDGDFAAVATEYAEMAEAYRSAALDAELDADALKVLPTLDARLASAMSSLGSLSRATTERLTAEHRAAVAEAEERAAASRARAAAYAAPLRALFADLVFLAGHHRDTIAEAAEAAAEALAPEVAAARAALAAAEAKVARVRSVPAYFREVAEAEAAAGLPPVPRALPLLTVPEEPEPEPEAKPKASRTRKPSA